MTIGNRTRLVPKRKVRPYQGRGGIYAWLRAHHADIKVIRPRETRLWAELVLDMVEDGVVDGTGEPPSAHNTRVTWPRVCRDVDAFAAIEVSPQRKPPSRMSPDWRPPEVVSRHEVVASPPRRSSAPLAVKESGPGPTPSVMEVRDSAFFDTVDPSGATVPPGHVFYDGEVMPLHAAQQLERSDRQLDEIDRGK